jgi:hypothetical protein
MATTKVSQIIIKKDSLANLPVLASGEFMLAKDEQRLFLGQDPIKVYGNNVGTSTTLATVTFTVKEFGVVKELDLDGISEFFIVVYDSENDTTSAGIPASSMQSINDSVLEFNHGLGRAPVAADSFTLHYNKEIMSYAGESASSNKLYSTSFPASNGVEKTTGIDFDSDVKNTVIINYTMHDASNKMRKGTLNILVYGDTTASPSSTAKHNIEDKYFGDSELDDVEFSISASGTTFTLNFKTAINSSLNFDYTQISTQNS